MTMRSPISSIVTVLVSSAALVLAAAACSSSGDNEDEGAYTLDNVCQRLAKEQCAAAQSCCESTWMGYEQAGCVAFVQNRCEETVAKVKEGKMAFDAGAIDPLLAAQAKFYQRCEVNLVERAREEFEKAWQRVFVGIVEEGGACQWDQECKQPSDTKAYARCKGEECSLRSMPSGRPGREGEVCDSRKECEEGLDCLSSAHVPDTDYKCVKLKTVGEPCTMSLEPECEAGSFCDSASHRCVDAKASGSACDEDDECRSRNCENSKCVSTDWALAVHIDLCRGEISRR